jgi:hypothetical protein
VTKQEQTARDLRERKPKPGVLPLNEPRSMVIGGWHVPGGKFGETETAAA